MFDVHLVHSGVSCTVTVDGLLLTIEVYRSPDEVEWTVEVVDEDGVSTVLEETFGWDWDALDFAVSRILSVGGHAFRHRGGDAIARSGRGPGPRPAALGR